MYFCKQHIIFHFYVILSAMILLLYTLRMLYFLCTLLTLFIWDSVWLCLVFPSYVHNQIVSVLTGSALTRMFEKRRNYDFRHLLGGTERLLDNLLNLLDCHPSFLLGAVQSLPLATSVRDTITQTIIQYCSKIKVPSSMVIHPLALGSYSV